MSKATGSVSRSIFLMRLAAGLMTILVAAAGAAIWQLRRDTIAEVQEDNDRLSIVLAEQTHRSLQSIDLVLQEVVESVASSDVHDVVSLRAMFDGLELHEMLKRRLVDLPQTEAFTLVDAAGRIVNASRQWPPPDYSLADRDYLRHFSTTPDTGPFISEPATSRSSGKLTVFLARRLSAADGSFVGVVVAPIRLSYFEDFFTRTGFPKGSGVTILRRDGMTLMRFPSQGVIPATHISTKVDWYRKVAAGGGRYRSTGGFAGSQPSYVSLRPLPTYPVVVDVFRLEQAALARWHLQAAEIGMGVLTAAAGMAMLLSALGRQITLSEQARRRIAQQIEATRASEARLARQSSLLEATLTHMDQGLMVVDGSGIVALSNRRAIDLLELPVELMASLPPLADVIALFKQRGEFDVPSDPPFDVDMLLQDNVAYERRRPNGVVLEVRTAPLPEGGMVRTFTDITARVAAEKMLSHEAMHDQLTGLANRAGFMRRLDAVLTAAQNAQSRFALLYLDLDRFKAVNDTYGHAAGDLLLRQVTLRMRESARAADVIARLGGDEFAIILAGSDLAVADRVALRLIEAIRLPYLLDGRTAQIGVSIGIAIYPTDGIAADQLLKSADAALYAAKGAGRSTWRAFGRGAPLAAQDAQETGATQV